MAVKEKLKEMPGQMPGLSENQAVRTIKLARPICPFSKIEMEKNDQGKWIARQGPTDPDRQNCQLAGGAWWKDCEARGHDPYFRVVVWYVSEDEYDEGTGELTGTKRFRRSMRLPNFSQTAVAPHLNSGQGARRAIQRKGAKRMEDIGYAEVCQYRNCKRPVANDAKTKEYGNYCCRQELALVAAALQGVTLHRPDARLNGDEVDKIERERQKQLMEAIAFVK